MLTITYSYLINAGTLEEKTIKHIYDMVYDKIQGNDGMKRLSKLAVRETNASQVPHMTSKPVHQVSGSSKSNTSLVGITHYKNDDIQQSRNGSTDGDSSSSENAEFTATLIPYNASKNSTKLDQNSEPLNGNSTTFHTPYTTRFDKEDPKKLDGNPLKLNKSALMRFDKSQTRFDESSKRLDEHLKSTEESSKRLNENSKSTNASVEENGDNNDTERSLIRMFNPMQAEALRQEIKLMKIIWYVFFY